MQQRKTAFKRSLSDAIMCFKRQDWENAYRHLEDAHILGQPYIVEHTLSHWWMFRVAIQTKDLREMFGQIPRIVASVIFSKIWVPVGNTGRSSVSALKPMPVPSHLKDYIS